MASALRASRTCTHTMFSGSHAGGASSLAIATAPLAIASFRNVFPSAFAPCSAKNSAPAATFRESQDSCRISTPAAPAVDAPADDASVTPSSNALSRAPGPEFDPEFGPEFVPEFPVSADSRASAASALTAPRSSSRVPLSPVVILFFGPCRLVALGLGRPKLNRHLRAMLYFSPCPGRLSRRQARPHQRRVQSQPQTLLANIAHGLPAEVRHGDISALVHRNHHRG